MNSFFFFYSLLTPNRIDFYLEPLRSILSKIFERWDLNTSLIFSFDFYFRIKDKIDSDLDYKRFSLAYSLHFIIIGAISLIKPPLSALLLIYSFKMQSFWEESSNTRAVNSYSSSPSSVLSKLCSFMLGTTGLFIILPKISAPLTFPIQGWNNISFTPIYDPSRYFSSFFSSFSSKSLI